MDPLSPEAKGARTMTATLDRWREVRPDKIFASMLRSTNIADGFRDVSMRDVANAADAFAWRLSESLGTSKSFETIAYVGVNDLRYAVFLYGAIKCGYKSLFVSPRNPPAQNASLLEQTQCRHFFHASEMSAVVHAVQSFLPNVSATPMQPLDHWLHAFTRIFPFDKLFEDAKWDPILVLHSSGSTGPPKPVTMNHGYFAAAEVPMRRLPGREPAGKPVFDFPGGGFFFTPFPFFHLAGLTAVCMYPVTASESSAVVALPDRPPTPVLVKQIIEQKSPRALYSPPSIIEAITQLPGGMDTLATLDVISYAGGPLSLSCGNALVQHVKLTTTYGSTETGGNHMLIPKPTDWNYLEFHPDFGIRMEPAVDGAYELVFRKKDAHAACRGVHWTFPSLEEFRTRDMFMAHPTKPGLWTFYARNDDIIVFANGAKYNPVPAESVLASNPALSGVLILGDGRTQAAALLEPKESPASREELIDRVWPDVVRANAQSQKQGHLTRRSIAVIDPGSAVRAPKGTIVRKLTVDKFKNVIDDLYSGGDGVSASVGPVLATPYNLQTAILNLVRECANQTALLAGIDEEDDFYVHGLDSVQTAELASMLKAGLRPQYGELPWLVGHTIFDHPTIKSLSAAIWNAIDSPPLDGSRHHTPPYLAAMDSMVVKYSKQVRAPDNISGAAEDVLRNTKARYVLLTGSTGFLGLRILQALLQMSDVEHVYCLDRGPHARSRVAEVLERRSELANALEKVTFHTAQLDHSHLGLSPDVYESLSQNVGFIIHNAWKVDFNHSLRSFEHVHVKGVSSLIDFAAKSVRRPPLTFVSSVSSVSRWPTIHGEGSPIPESVIADSLVAETMGYSQSKQVAERIIANSASSEASGLRCRILRAGQVAGPVDPTYSGPNWNKAEWFPALLQTSKELGCVSEWLPEVDWIPVDVLGSIVAQLALHDADATAAATMPTTQVYHLLNPHKTPWAELVPVVQARFGGASACPTVPYATWLAKLQKADAHDGESLVKLPALKIFGFFDALAAKQATRGSPKFEVERAAGVSPTIRSLVAVKPRWLDGWMETWGM